MYCYHIIKFLLKKKAFDTNKTRLLKMMLKKVEEAITEDHEELGEATYDLQRAFEMFLQTDYFSKEVNNLNTTSTSLVDRLLLY